MPDRGAYVGNIASVLAGSGGGAKVGDVRYYPAGSSPSESGWLRADGQRLSSATYAGLFATRGMNAGWSPLGAVDDGVTNDLTPGGTIGVRVVGNLIWGVFNVAGTSTFGSMNLTTKAVTGYKTATQIKSGWSFFKYMGEANGYHFMQITDGTNRQVWYTQAQNNPSGAWVQDVTLSGDFSVAGVVFCTTSGLFIATGGNGLRTATTIGTWALKTPPGSAQVNYTPLELTPGVLHVQTVSGNWCKSSDGGITWGTPRKPVNMTGIFTEFPVNSYLITGGKLYFATVGETGFTQVFSTTDPGGAGGITIEYTSPNGSAILSNQQPAGIAMTSGGYIIFAWTRQLIIRRPDGTFLEPSTPSTNLATGASITGTGSSACAVATADNKLWIFNNGGQVLMDFEHEFLGPTIPDVVGQDGVTYNAYVKGKL